MTPKTIKSKKKATKQEKDVSQENQSDNDSIDERLVRDYQYMKSSVENNIKQTLKRLILETKESHLSELSTYQQHDMYNNFFQLYGRRYGEALLEQQSFLFDNQLSEEFFNEFVTIHLDTELPIIETEDQQYKLCLSKEQLALVYYIELQNVKDCTLQVYLDSSISSLTDQQLKLLNGLFYLAEKFKELVIVQNQQDINNSNFVFIQTETHDVLNVFQIEKQELDQLVYKKQIIKALNNNKISKTIKDINFLLCNLNLITSDQLSESESESLEEIESSTSQSTTSSISSSTFGFSADFFDEIESGIEEASEYDEEEEEEEKEEEDEEEEENEEQNESTEINEITQDEEASDSEECEEIDEKAENGEENKYELEVQDAQNDQYKNEENKERLDDEKLIKKVKTGAKSKNKQKPKKVSGKKETTQNNDTQIQEQQMQDTQ